MAPLFVAHIIAWMQSILFIVTEIMYAPIFWPNCHTEKLNQAKQLVSVAARHLSRLAAGASRERLHKMEW